MKRNELLRTMAEIAVFSALGYVLDILAGLYSKFLFINGGSLTIAMAAVFIMSFRRGFWAGFLTGLIMGLLSMTGTVYAITDAWWKVFLQLGFDYFLAYAAAGTAGLFRKWALSSDQNRKKQALIISLGCLTGGMMKFMCHFVSGGWFWPDDLWGVGGPWIYSFLYNISYTLPSTVLSLAVVLAVFHFLPQEVVYKGTSLKTEKA